jgi:hypothetical protein
MFTDSLPTNAWLSGEVQPSRLQHAIIPLSIEWPAGPGHSERADRNQALPPQHPVATADRRF